MSLIQTFLQKYPLNKVIDYDGRYGGQCFDVANAWIDFITGKKPKIILTKASDIYKKPNLIIPDGIEYEKIFNNPHFIPQEGDIIVWDDKDWSGFFGHVAICLSSSNISGLVLQQNGLLPTEGLKKITWFWSNSNNNFLGVIRIKTNQNSSKQNSNNNQAMSQQERDNYNQKIQDLENQLNSEKKEHQSRIKEDEAKYETLEKIGDSMWETLQFANGNKGGDRGAMKARFIWNGGNKEEWNRDYRAGQEYFNQIKDVLIEKDNALKSSKEKNEILQEQNHNLSDMIEEVEKLKSYSPLPLLKDLEPKLVEPQEISKNPIQEKFSFLKAFKGTEKTGGFSALFISLASVLLAFLVENEPLLREIILPKQVVNYGGVVSILFMFLKTLYSLLQAKKQSKESSNEVSILN
jgi:hypothetical protein